MASMQDQLYKEMEVAGLAKFTAYCNKSVKVVFEDRTIVRMVHGCENVRLLTRLGEEIMVNMNKQHPLLIKEYINYIKVAEEFFEWAFLTHEERLRKEAFANE